MDCAIGVCIYVWRCWLQGHLFFLGKILLWCDSASFPPLFSNLLFLSISSVLLAGRVGLHNPSVLCFCHFRRVGTGFEGAGNLLRHLPWLVWRAWATLPWTSDPLRPSPFSSGRTSSLVNFEAPLKQCLFFHLTWPMVWPWGGPIPCLGCFFCPLGY